MKSILLSCALIPLLAASTFAGALIDDHFTSPQLTGRDLSPGRGTWKIADGIATCTQDVALYAKNKDHGPVIWYDPAFTDATVRFAIRPEKVRNFVFTLNDEKGHVFRYVLDAKGVSVRAWKTQGHDAKPDVLPATNPPQLADDTWIQAELKFAGDRCTLKIGPDFTQTFQHPVIAKKKTKMGLGFAFGTLSVRDVSIVVF
jgi:hypothetical protein